MKRFLSFVLIFFAPSPSFAQSGFEFENEATKVVIPFQLINNLIFIPLTVNGVELTFLVDSGVEETVLFSLEDKKELNLKNKETVSLIGLGSNEKIDGLKSTGNLLKVAHLVSKNHLIYVIVDQDFNLSSHIGIPVNGIIGYSFLKNNLVAINYKKQKIIIYKENAKRRKKLEKKFTHLPITIERAKPYLNSSVIINEKEMRVKLLIDLGNSDAVWLFKNKKNDISIPPLNFEDYLGQGFSGDVMGKRAKISEFKIGGFKFEKPIVAFPDSVSLQHVKMVAGRVGSVGGEIFKRFSVVLDYTNESLFLKKNNDFKADFHYNKSGIEVKHIGMQWVKETVLLKLEPKYSQSNSLSDTTIDNDFKYKFQLKPVYVINNVRQNSDAEKSGLRQGDIIIKINGNDAYRYSLKKIASILKSDEEKWLSLEIERESQLFKFRFQLKNILEP